MRSTTAALFMAPWLLVAGSAFASGPAPVDAWDPVEQTPAAAPKPADGSDPFADPTVVDGGFVLPRPASATRHPRTHWSFYGWQSMVVGEIGAGLTVLGYYVGSAKVAVPGLVMYTVAEPVLQRIHGSTEKMYGAIALTVGLPLTGAGLGALVAFELRRNPGYWAVAGTGIGMAAAPIADGLFLGWEKTKMVSPSAKHATALPLLQCATSPDGRNGSFVVGASGVF